MIMTISFIIFVFLYYRKLKRIEKLEDEKASLQEVIRRQNKFGPSSMSEFWKTYKD